MHHCLCAAVITACTGPYIQVKLTRGVPLRQDYSISNDKYQAKCRAEATIVE